MTAPRPDPNPMQTWRDSVRRLAPRWLQTGIAEKILYALTLPLDTLGEATENAVKLRFPGYSTFETLPLIGRERKIRRGREEADAVYAARLKRWLDAHRHRGNPKELLRQLHAYFAPNNFQIDLVNRQGLRFRLAPDGAITWDYVGFDPYDGDDPNQWAKWKLYYTWPGEIITDGIWSDPGVWSDGGAWDSNLTVDDIADLRLIPREWNAARCIGRIAIFTSATELWDFPPGIWSDPGDWLAEADVQSFEIEV